ncbi:hypothetical protein [Bradyrhizobium prioriisuperbiae]|uniref:terminase small subunit-like protein n=1 Tax=Bradyrhizobium prioriisuperbiae TaxID=2854389 RepID=UPI0028EACDFC|nr:hypothetical protein [Bradyrhizobium prioritasuperba]
MTPVTRTSPVYSRDLADDICAQLSQGCSLRVICRDTTMPGERTVRTWVAQDRDGFAARYRASTRRKGAASCYSEALAARICAALMAGRPLQRICRAPGMPRHSTVLRWARRDHHGFAMPYAFARAFGAQALGDQMLDIADDSRGDWRIGKRGRMVRDRQHMARARLRFRLRREQLARSMPKDGGTWELPRDFSPASQDCCRTAKSD